MPGSTPQLASSIYEGTVRHRRLHEGDTRSFQYPMFMMYLDLSEVERIFESRWLWSTKRPNVAQFRREDYFGDPSIALDHAVRSEVERVTGERPTGPIRLLTHLRYLGYCVNPVSFYYCFDPPGERVEAIVAEITNTPWGERRAHVLHREQSLSHGDKLRFQFAKDFHVSPFMDLAYEYDWRFTPPSRSIVVHMENRRDGQSHFDATLTLNRTEISGAALASVLVRYPLMTLQVVARIYFQALLLWISGRRFIAHPNPGHPATTPHLVTASRPRARRSLPPSTALPAGDDR